MGWFAKLLGRSPEQRLAKARQYLADGEFNEARAELDDLDHPDAAFLAEKARQGLVVINLEEATARFRAGDFDGGNEHLQLAGSFGATGSQLREIRAVARERRAEQEAEAAAQAAEPTLPEGTDPLWALPPDDPRLRYALLLEGWPDDLRERLARLGPDFARLVMMIEEGDAAAVVQSMGPFVAKDPVARYERARAALQVNLLPQAASDLLTFGDQIGHQRIGNGHTAITLAQVLSGLGRGDEALALIDRQIASGDKELGLKGVRVSLLEATGKLTEAETAALTLLKEAPKDQGLYRLLARVRVALGNRGGATQALEGSLAHTCSSPGKCGNQPFDVQGARMLASLYLEDRAQPERVAALLRELGQHVQEPAWEDRYLSALRARNDGLPGVDRLAGLLRQELRPGDPRLRLVERAFPEAVAG